MSKFVVLLLVLSLCSIVGSGALAQEPKEKKAVNGYVILEEGTPAEMALVALHADSVTANPVRFTYTDKSGFYVLNIEPPYAKQYLVEVCYVGFEAVVKTIPTDSIAGISRRDFNLAKESKTVEMDAVRVSALRKVGINRQSYSFSSAQMREAKTSFNLALLLPELKLAGNGEIASAIGGEPPLILINGHHGTMQELRSIPASKIVHIDYFDVAPERYNTTKPVIDVITKPLDDGHHAGFEVYTAPLMSDVSGRIYYNYNSGGHQFKLFSKGFFRKLRKGRIGEEITDYTTWRQNRYEVEGLSKFTSSNAFLKLSYSYNEPKKQFLEVFYSGRWDQFSNPNTYEGLVLLGNNRQQRRGTQLSNNGSLVHVVDLYYDHYFAKRNDKLTANVVYTNANSYTKYAAHEYLIAAKEEGVMANDLNAKTDKNSIIAQLDYELPIGKMAFNAGTTLMFSHAKIYINQSDALNAIDQQHQLRDRAYAAWSISRNNFFFRAVPAVNVHYVSSHRGLDQSQVHWTFNPSVSFGWYLPHNSRLRLDLGTQNNIPEFGETTEATIQIREDLYRRNNPMLKNSYDAMAQLSYMWRNAYIAIRSAARYGYTHRFWYVGYGLADIGGRKAMVTQANNGQFSQLAELSLSLSIKPLGDDRLTLSPYAKACYSLFQFTKEKAASGFSFPAGASISFQYQGWGAQGDVSIPYSALSQGSYTKNHESTSLMGFWGNDSWSIYLALEYMFRAVSYETVSHDVFDLYQWQRTTEQDEHWKASLTVSYYFSAGNDYRPRRSLENEDTDRGTLY